MIPEFCFHFLISNVAFSGELNFGLLLNSFSCMQSKFTKLLKKVNTNRTQLASDWLFSLSGRSWFRNEWSENIWVKLFTIALFCRLEFIFISSHVHVARLHFRDRPCNTLYYFNLLKKRERSFHRLGHSELSWNISLEQWAEKFTIWFEQLFSLIVPILISRSNCSTARWWMFWQVFTLLRLLATSELTLMTLVKRAAVKDRRMFANKKESRNKLIKRCWPHKIRTPSS